MSRQTKMNQHVDGVLGRWKDKHILKGKIDDAIQLLCEAFELRTGHKIANRNSLKIELEKSK